MGYTQGHIRDGQLHVRHTNILVCSSGVTNQKFNVATIPNRIFPPIFKAFGQLHVEGKNGKLTFGKFFF